MKRFFRILLNAATVLSLVLCAATAVLWVRSYWVVDSIAWNGPGAAAKISTADCTVEIWCLPGHLDGRADGWSYETWENDRTEYLWGMYEFRVDGQLKVALPYWLLCVSAAAIALLGRIVRRRHANGAIVDRCPACGYDLRATPDRCPECGAAPPPPPAAAAPPAEPARPGGAGG